MWQHDHQAAGFLGHVPWFSCIVGKTKPGDSIAMKALGIISSISKFFPAKNVWAQTEM